MSPRVESDGKMQVANIGTPEEPVIVAAPGTLAEDMFDWTAFFDTVREKATEYLGSPKRELLFRLNERLQGRDPGEPFNWRGLR